MIVWDPCEFLQIKKSMLLAFKNG